eukprot:7996265-Pyramimonas_sp.AAC.1
MSQSFWAAAARVRYSAPLDTAGAPALICDLSSWQPCATKRAFVAFWLLLVSTQRAPTGRMPGLRRRSSFSSLGGSFL